ncbi:hypothetical protein [Marinomonas ostreistagni]|uniref:hypothetical protein n=1 Tax=Marinomonas ostreistagni TaxID=359209 RepID=UPI0019511EDB|nr:hypothetical protein [Marinomonas ostreistagni]MBM6550195.1 hypothetical protein [Marinomonas ostreistagni]
MARKANISKEEIIDACWQLIEQNTFPNIPRLSAYFQQLDGRACSNTTLLNGINDWEERYREQQESELADLKDNLAPSFKRFERDVVQALTQVLDEKVQAHEDSLALRQQALEGRSDAMSEVYAQVSDDLERVQFELSERDQEKQQLAQDYQIMSERYEHALARNRVLETQLEQNQRTLQERDAQYNQAQVDLAKQDKQILMLQEALNQAQQQVERLSEQQNDNQQQMLARAIIDLQEIAQSLPKNQADS